MSQDRKYEGLDAYIKFNYEDGELLLQSECFWTGDSPIGIGETFWTVEHFKERCIEHIKERLVKSSAKSLFMRINIILRKLSWK